jgi:hypothetical protein
MCLTGEETKRTKVCSIDKLREETNTHSVAAYLFRDVPNPTLQGVTNIGSFIWGCIIQGRIVQGKNVWECNVWGCSILVPPGVFTRRGTRYLHIVNGAV